MIPSLRREPFQPLDLDAIRRVNPLPGVVGAMVQLQRAGQEWKGCCPLHADRSPSFTIFSGNQRFHCFGCGATGDVLDFVRQLHGVSLRDAAAMLGAGDLPTVSMPVLANDDTDRGGEARAIWASAISAKGTLAETYLHQRGVRLPDIDTIRFARLGYGARGEEYPCLVAAVQSADDQVIGIQRTYLNPSGTGKAAVPKAKLSLGKVSGGAIRLAPVAGDLVVCEGLEDGLTLQQELGQAVWVAAGASMLPAMQFPPVVASVAIGGDNDAAGRAAAEKAARAFLARFLRVRTFYPAAGFKDFNQELMEGARA